jgi:hypothetical protein
VENLFDACDFFNHESSTVVETSLMHAISFIIYHRFFLRVYV